MPRATAYRLTWIPEGEIYELRESQHNQVLPVTPGSHAWFAWLAAVPSFTFNGQAGQLTVRQEVRPRGGAYWYACRRTGKKMSKRYLGRTIELTPTRLEEVAAQLAEAVLSARPATRTRSASPTAPLPAAMIVGEASLAPPLAIHHAQLAIKLHMPHLRPRLVHRGHLIEHLQQGREAPLTLISAPAGFGKTTLLAQWLAERGSNAAWLSLEPEDNEPMLFLSSVIAALQTLDPSLGSSALALLQAKPPAPPPLPEAVLAQLAAEFFEQSHREMILVLDDYHVITTQSLQRAVAAFLEHLPPQLHLIIATRVDPALPLARLRARGQLCEVRATHLQFRTEETGAFLQTVMGLDLPAEAVTALQIRTEGWIAGLQLAALSLQGRSDPQQLLADFTGSHRHIVDYLVEEVLARQPKAMQAFLLRTSILDRLTGPLCDAVTGGSNSDALLEQIERTNLFLIPLDERRQWYRYHHLFAEVLRARVLREVGTEGLSALYTRASVWYEQHGMQALAIEAALSAGDFERASRSIDEPLVTSMILSLQFATLIRWLECFPREQLFTNAFLCLTYAFSLFGSETPQAHEGPLAVAEQLFQAEGNHKGLGQAYTLRAIAARTRGDGVQAIKYGSQAFQLLPEDALLARSTATSALAEGYQLNGEVVAARRVLADARSLHEQVNNLSSILGDTIARGDLLIMQGKLREATDVYAPVPEAAGERQYFAIQALIGLGNIAYECNERDKAETHLERAITLARKTRDTVLLARASLVHARVIQACGDAEHTSEEWASTLLMAQACGYTGIVEQAQAYQVRGWLKLGRREEAIQWQKASSFAHDAPPSYPQEVLALTLVRCLLAQGEAGEALRMLGRWRQHARVQERTGSEIEMLMLSALAYAKQGKAEQAGQLLQQALLLASPEGYIRVFVDEGVPMIALLSLVLSRWKNKPEASSLHALLSVLHAEQPTQGSLAPTAPHRKSPLDPLTDRERKVLRLLSVGLSNAEIAAELVVSINTVKTQARSIYQKLNAKNRHEAVALARHWRLL